MITEPLLDILPNEVIRMCLQELSHRQRASIVRVCNIFKFLIGTFKDVPKSYSFVKSFGTSGGKNIQFRSCSRVKIYRNTGHILIADICNYRIQVFNNKFEYMFKFRARKESMENFNFPNA